MSVLVQRSVFRTLVSMAVPMLAGTFAMNAYSLTDTWFVSRLGTVPLAAMGFTFPVVMLIRAVAIGIGSGVTPLVSHAIGRADHKDAAKLTTHGMLYTSIIILLISVAGYLLIDPVFRKLGADAETLPLVSEYMQIWYAGAFFMTVTMYGNGVLLSIGDAKNAAGFMILGTVVNIILDPIMIFGYLGFSAMGIRGAALATIISQIIASAWLFYLICPKHKLLVWQVWGINEYAKSFIRIVTFAVPSVLSMILMPISATVITRLLSSFGNSAVAAIGVITRIEMFAFMIPMALGISLVPFVGQNFGAGRNDRLHQAWTICRRFAIVYGGIIAVLFFVSAKWLASVFTDDPDVASTITMYVRIVPFGYGMMEVHRYGSLFLNGLHRPRSSAIINAVRVLVFLIPLSCLGTYWYEVAGLFAGRLATDLIAGIMGIVWVMFALRKLDKNELSVESVTVE